MCAGGLPPAAGVCCEQCCPIPGDVQRTRCSLHSVLFTFSFTRIATLAYCPVFGWKCNIGAMGLFAVGVNYVIFNKKLYELQRSNEAPVFFAPSTNTPISRSYVPPINV
eukprot:TRINITY_DN12705_c0_g1_i11.p3 TRINITY_DN12705_c0_g1~~TRINITY_DN12705_c0_g1_i11.p3  ORF type:complete len:109 (-),score=5.10 TRINITY_DN12705_c0_g1_i11:116-442(-)